MANVQIADGPSSWVYMEEPNKYAFPDASHEGCQPCGCPFLLLTGGLTLACICCFLWSRKGEGCGEGRQNNVLPQRTTEDVMEPKGIGEKKKFSSERSRPWPQCKWGETKCGRDIGETGARNVRATDRHAVSENPRGRPVDELVHSETWEPLTGMWFQRIPVDVLWMSWSTQL